MSLPAPPPFFFFLPPRSLLVVLLPPQPPGAFPASFPLVLYYIRRPFSRPFPGGAPSPSPRRLLPGVSSPSCDNTLSGLLNLPGKVPFSAPTLELPSVFTPSFCYPPRPVPRVPPALASPSLASSVRSPPFGVSSSPSVSFLSLALFHLSQFRPPPPPPARRFVVGPSRSFRLPIASFQRLPLSASFSRRALPQSSNSRQL